MKLSVIIPCLNGAQTLSAQLDALAAQEWSEPWEVIVADNGSTDASLAIAGSYAGRIPNLRIVDASARRGQPFALNTGAGAAYGESLAFCDADDEVAPGWVAAMGSALHTHEFVACRIELRKLNEAWLTKSRRNPQEASVQRYPAYLDHAGGGTLGVRRRIYHEAGGFDEDFPLLHDTDFCWKILRRGVRLHFVPDAVMHVRLRGDLRGIYLQAQGYGEYNVKLCKRYYEHGMPKPSARSGIMAWLYLARHFASIRDRGDLANFMWQLGYRKGRLIASIRHGTFAI